MANFPFGGFRIPSADPPYPLHIKKDGVTIILTDNCGIEFQVLGDKHMAAVAYLEYAIKDMANVSNNDFTTRIGAISFVVKNRQIIEIKPNFDKKIEYVSHTPEDRPEVLEMIEIMRSSLKSMMKMKAFW